MRCAGAARWVDTRREERGGRKSAPHSDSEEALRCRGFFRGDSGEHHAPCFQDWGAAGGGAIGTQILDHRLVPSMLKTLRTLPCD